MVGPRFLTHNSNKAFIQSICNVAEGSKIRTRDYAKTNHNIIRNNLSPCTNLEIVLAVSSPQVGIASSNSDLWVAENF